MFVESKMSFLCFLEKPFKVFIVFSRCSQWRKTGRRGQRKKLTCNTGLEPNLNPGCRDYVAGINGESSVGGLQKQHLSHPCPAL